MMKRSCCDDDNNDNEITVQGDFCLRVFSTRHLWTLVWVRMSSPARPQCLPGHLDSFCVEIVILMTKETLYCINWQMHQQSWSQFQLILNYSDDLRTFWETLGKKVLFWVKNSVSRARSALFHGIYCIFYWVKFANLRLRTKTTHLSRKL